MSMRSLSIAAAGLVTALFIAAAPAVAQAPSPEAEQACTPDVMRLCQDLVQEANHGKIAACLKRKVRALSPECRSVMRGGAKTKHRRHRKG